MVDTGCEAKPQGLMVTEAAHTAEEAEAHGGAFQQQ